MLNNSSPPPTPPTANVRAHYPPGLLDLSRRWVNRLPVAPWICYLALFVLLYVLFNLFYWIDGLQPWGRLRLLPSPIIAWNVLTLATGHGARASHGDPVAALFMAAARAPGPPARPLGRR